MISYYQNQHLFFYKNSDDALKKKLDHSFQILQSTPYKHNNIKKLKGSLSIYFRYRIGDFRIIYKIDVKMKLVTIVIIAHRSKVYKKL